MTVDSDSAVTVDSDSAVTVTSDSAVTVASDSAVIVDSRLRLGYLPAEDASSRCACRLVGEAPAPPR